MKTKQIYILKNIVILIITTIICTTCIDNFKTISGSAEGLFCVDASLVKNHKIQRVVLSRSVGNTEDTIPFEGNCSVYVEDELGNTRNFTEVSQGVYEAAIDDEYLVINRQYRLHIETEDGEIYQSDFDKLYDCPPVDSFYYMYEYKYSNQQKENVFGFQFYVDVQVKEGYASFYRWMFEEDWEWRIPYVYYGIWNGNELQKDVKDFSRCFKHIETSSLSCTSTENLENTTIKKRVPIFFLRYYSQKLRYRYALLTKQVSLSSNAYAYWQQKKVEIQESGGMYTTQPSQNITNITNINNEDELVLGYFWVGKETEKRYLINRPVHWNEPFISCVPLVPIICDYQYEQWHTMYYDTSGILIDTLPPNYNGDFLSAYTESITLYNLVECQECDDPDPCNNCSYCYPMEYCYVGYYEEMLKWDLNNYDTISPHPEVYSLTPDCFDCRGPNSDTAVPYFWKK